MIPILFSRTVSVGVALLLFSRCISLADENPESQLPELFAEIDLQELAATNKDAQVYRLTVIRSFDDPMQFLLSRGKHDFAHDLEVKKVRREASGPVYLYTKLVRDSRLKLKSEETRSFAALLEAAGFWSMPEGDHRRQGLDGSTWILEGIRDGKYHKVSRENPFLEVKTFEEVEKHSGLPPLTAGQAYGEGLLAAAFAYLWALAGETGEELY